MELLQLPLTYCAPRDLESSSLRAMHLTMRQAYHVLRLMCERHTRNGVFIAAQHLPLMTEQMQTLSRLRVSWGIAATLEAMFDNNKVHASSVASWMCKLHGCTPAQRRGGSLYPDMTAADTVEHHRRS